MAKPRCIRLNRSGLAYSKELLTYVHLFFDVSKLLSKFVENIVHCKIIVDVTKTSVGQAILPPPCEGVSF